MGLRDHLTEASTAAYDIIDSMIDLGDDATIGELSEETGRPRQHIECVIGRLMRLGHVVRLDHATRRTPAAGRPGGRPVYRYEIAADSVCGSLRVGSGRGPGFRPCGWVVDYRAARRADAAHGVCEVSA